jgi:hypothetical protein
MEAKGTTRAGDAVQLVILVIRNIREVAPESANRLRQRGTELQRVQGSRTVIMRLEPARGRSPQSG